ncbi:hypothetical protein PR002_g27201, partial [Phytophthora rubi]
MAMKRVPSGHEEVDKESAGELIDKDVIERCNFLMRHAPPSNYLSLKIKGKFVQLIKRLEKVDLRNHRLSRDDCLQPSGVVWKTGEEIEVAGRDDFPEDVMTCTIAKDLFKLWPLLSFMQGIGTLYQVDGRAIDLGRKIVHLIDELGKEYPALAKLLDPPTVIFNLQAMNVNPAEVVIPPGLAPGNVPAFPGAVGIWTCPSELRAGELIGHLRSKLAPTLPNPPRNRQVDLKRGPCQSDALVASADTGTNRPCCTATKPMT